MSKELHPVDQWTPSTAGLHPIMNTSPSTSSTDFVIPTVSSVVPGSESTWVEYRNKLAELRLTRSHQSITNRFPRQGRYAFQELAQLACELQSQQPTVIRILTGSLPWNIYGPPVADRIAEFLKAGGEVRILVWNEESITTVQNLRILQSVGEKLSYRISGTSENGDKLSHMFLVSKEAYRLEVPHANDSETVFTDTFPLVPAIINFNDKSGGQSLCQHFDILWNACAPGQDRSSVL